MKKIIALVLCVLLIAPCAGVYASADETADSPPFVLEFDGEDITEYLYYDPIVDEDGVVYFALEDVLEMLELYYTLEYDEETNTMSVADDRMGPEDREFMDELEGFMPYENLDYEAYFSDVYFMDGIREAFSMANPESALLFFIGDFVYWLNDDRDSSELYDLWDKLFRVESGEGGEGSGEEAAGDSEDEPSVDGLTFGDTFTFGDLEITVGDWFELVENEDAYLEDLTGDTLIRIPMTVKNTSGSTVNLYSELSYVVFGAGDSEVDDINYYMDDSLSNVGRLRRNGTVDTYFYIPYDGDTDYVIEFYDDWEEIYLELIIPVNEANAK
jgi:hypothetical protein